MKTAITGGIGSGKSYVCRLLAARHGISIYDCDAAAKRLMHHSPLLRQQLTGLIGPNAYAADGKLNKAVVTRFLMASPANAEAINAIVHPAVMDDFSHSGLQWLESAILFEACLNHLFDHVVVVTAPEEVRLQRIMQRDAIGPEKARQWMNQQWPQQKLEERAHFLIVNDGLTPLEPQTDRLLQWLKQEESRRHQQ